MGRKGLIGNWQQSKYVSRETSGRGLLLRPSTAWYCEPSEQPQTIYSYMPESNVQLRIVAQYEPTVMLGDIREFVYPDGRVVNVESGTNMRVAVFGYAVWNILNSIDVSEAWEQGVIQRQAYENFIDVCERNAPTLFIPPGYDNGNADISGYYLNTPGRWIDTIGGGTGGQLNYYPDFRGVLISRYISAIAPMPKWPINSYASFETTGTADGDTNSRGIWGWRTYYYFV